ncbi:hypothetical protein PTD2_08899 [Pseudoalteromonas tunicata D2]|uniref:Uncharacterized protein n=1 Tax=Pseudoalteromonas tunicata D2 TaxID=87626 RepID=A4C985_9GAMM|nr:hypothetical protein PTD2_08899 [Pseudoalteromonas tunicata D2]
MLTGLRVLKKGVVNHGFYQVALLK